ncbi:hypothetical protein IGI39_003419 [Enterococcus sp. AZ135]|uniref:transcriptional regulator GutM n=1 Tax=unclassified Enterococcus TaxID=2608891 RepID=UPI003F25B0CC
MSYSRETIFILYALFIIAFFIQCYLSYLQNKALQQEVMKMNRMHSNHCYVTVGKKRARFFRRGYVVILAVDASQTIVQARILSGLTVFARMKQETEIVGQNINYWKQLEKRQMTYKDHAVADAIDKLLAV